MDNKQLFTTMAIKQDFRVDWKQDTKDDFRVDYQTTASTPAPVSAFVADHTSGAHPLTVNFADNSTGVVASYTWDFGDGNTSAEQNPTHVYAAPGTYTVKQTVAGPGGSNTGTRAGYVTVS